MTENDGDPGAIWKHIGLHGHSVGTFLINLKGIEWKSGFGSDDTSGTTRSLAAQQIRGAQFTVFGKSGHVRIQSKDKGEWRLDGFPPHHFDNLKEKLKAFDVDLQKHSMSSAGTSFGNSKISGQSLVFSRCILEDDEEEGQEFEARDGNEFMSIDLTQVSQCVLPGNNRNEIELQFPESDAVEAGTDQLVAIRFYIPPDPETEGDKSAPSAAELFQERITKQADIKGMAAGKSVLVEFDEFPVLTPRGRYSIELYSAFLRMRGNKYDYKIKYDDISRLFLLPKPDDVHMAFVIALDKPIRQGQQRYQYLVLQTTKEQAQITVNLDEETLKKEYNNDLQPVMTGSLSNLVAKTFKVICRKKVFIPGKFANANQQACVKCALRANEGHLYPLEKQFIFIHKPPLLVRFDEVESVEFQRYAGGQGSTRNFDLNVTLKNQGGGPTKEYTFSGIDRSDYAGLYNFLSGKRIRIKNIQNEEMQVSTPAARVYDDEDDGEEESDDEDYDANAKESEGSSSEDISDDDDDLDDVVDDSDDSDLEEARKKARKEQKKKNAEKQTKPKKRKSDSIESSSPKKKKKKKKDPNAPKKNMSAFMYFSTANRARIKEANPDLSFGEIARKVSEEYKKISEEEKAKLDARAEKDKRRYEEEMANYSAPSSDSDESTTEVNKKPKKDKNAPKRARTAYTYFVAEEREKIKSENPDASFANLSKMVGEAFKKLTPDEKKKWDEMAAKDKIRYQNEMKNYVPPAGSKTAKGSKKAGKGPKRAMSSFMFYSNSVRAKVKEENPDLSFGELGKHIGKLFRELAPEEKKEYEDKAAADKERYKEEMEEYTKKQKADAAKDDISDSHSDDSDDDSSDVLSDNDDGSDSDDSD